MTSRVGPEEGLSDPTLRLEVTGKVLSIVDCGVGLSNVTVEIWYAGEPDTDGNYYQTDEYRGQVMTNECGEYSFTQTFPAFYPTRPIFHNHFRLSRDGEALLVTQMYFEGDMAGYVSASSGSRELQTVQVLQDGDGARTVEFNMYVNAAEGGDSNCPQANTTPEPSAAPTTTTPCPPPPHVLFLFYSVGKYFLAIGVT